MPGLPGRKPSHLPAPRLRRHRLPGLAAVLLDGAGGHPRPPARRLSLRDAALVEPTAVAVHDVRRARLAPGERSSSSEAGRSACYRLCRPRGGGEVRILRWTPTGAVADRLGLRRATRPMTTCVAGRRMDRRCRCRRRVRGVRAQPRSRHRRRRAGGARPARGVAIHSVAARGQPAPVLLAGAHHDRRPPLPAGRLRAGGRAGRRGRRAGGRPDLQVVPLDEVAEAFVLLESGGGVMKVLVDCRASADA